MEWVTALRGTVVALDTAPLIYLIEENPTFVSLVRPFFEAVDRDEFRVVTSVVTLTEVLVHPLRHGDQELADQYRRILLHARQLTAVPVSEAIAEQAAQLRATHSLRTPDAIQLATAINSGASSFLTNDNRFPSLTSLKVLVLNQLTASQP
jgi:predicted nucleic acid-binding protein